MNGRVILPMVAIAAFFSLVICLVALSYRLDAANTRADGFEQSANSAATVTSNVLLTLSIMNTVTEANQNAKQQNALESQRTKNDITVAVTGDDCANRNIPAAAVNRLREYADSLRSSPNGPVTGQPDG